MICVRAQESWLKCVFFVMVLENGIKQHKNCISENHICQCITLDRKFCPVCNKPCHHDTTLNPKQKIDPGYGGMSSTIETSM